MKIKNFNIKTVAILLFTALCLANSGYGEDLLDEEYRKQLNIEIQLLKKMESRFNELGGSVELEEGLSQQTLKSGKKGGVGGGQKKKKSDDIAIFSEIEGLRIIRKRYEFGIYLFSVTADEVSVKDVFKQLAHSNNLKISFERIEPVILRKAVEISLNGLPFQDVLEIVSGIFGLEFMINEKNKGLTVTIPSNIGIETPEKYFRNKIVKTFRKAQIKYPGDENIPESHYKLGDYFYSVGLKIIASQEYKMVAERYPRHELAKKSLIKIAQCFMDIGDYKRARDMFDKYIEQYPNDAALDNVYFAITDTWFKEGKYNIAISIYKKILELYPGTELAKEIRERVAMARYKNKEYAKAFNILIALKKSRKKSDWNVEKDFIIGECLFNMGKYDDAFVVFANVGEDKELDKGNVKTARLRKAECLQKTDHCVEAIQGFNNWMHIYGNDVKAMLLTGKCLRKVELYSLAIDILDKALPIDQAGEYKWKIKYEIALTLFSSELYDGAITAFSEIAENNDGGMYLNSIFYEAESYFNRKEYKDAVTLYKKVSELMDKETERYDLVVERIAECYQNMGLFSKALDVYQ